MSRASFRSRTRRSQHASGVLNLVGDFLTADGPDRRLFRGMGGDQRLCFGSIHILHLTLEPELQRA